MVSRLFVIIIFVHNLVMLPRLTESSIASFKAKLMSEFKSKSVSYTDSIDTDTDQEAGYQLFRNTLSLMRWHKRLL
jgi:hypothetical protein